MELFSVCLRHSYHFVSASTMAGAQQTELKRYDLYVGFADLNSPALGLNQTGLHTQFGVNMLRWYALSFDYSVSSGSTALKADLLPVTLQEQLAPLIEAYIEAGIIPPTYQLTLPLATIFSPAMRFGGWTAIWRCSSAGKMRGHPSRSHPFSKRRRHRTFFGHNSRGPVRQRTICLAPRGRFRPRRSGLATRSSSVDASAITVFTLAKHSSMSCEGKLRT